MVSIVLLLLLLAVVFRLPFKAGAPGVIRRLAIVIAIFLLLAFIGAHFMAPKISYSLKEADCSPAAIEARNKAEATESKACVLVVRATNLKDKPERFVDWDGIGGGPFSGKKPMIRIFTTNDKFCYASPGPQHNSFSANETLDLPLRCGGAADIPKDYDIRSDENPVRIVISGYSKATFNLNPAR